MKRPVLSLLLVSLCACGPKADAPATSVPDDATAAPADDAMSGDDAVGGTADAEAAGPVTVTLHNLCDKPQSWVVIDGDETPDPSAGEEIAPGATTQVQLGPDQSVARKDDDGQWSSRASTDVEGGHVWMSSSCEGIGATDDPDADPAAKDAEMRKKFGGGS